MNAAANVTDQPVYFTPAEAAVRLRSSVPTLARWRIAGRGPTYLKNGGKVLYSEAALAAYEAANTRQRTREDA